MAAVACGLAISCSGTLWAERLREPEAYLSHPWVAWFWPVGLLLFGSVPCFAVTAVHGTHVSWDFLDDTYKRGVPAYSSWSSWPLSCVDIVCAWPVLLFSGFSPPSVGLSRVECSTLLHSFLFTCRCMVPFLVMQYMQCWVFVRFFPGCYWLLMDSFPRLSNILKLFLCEFSTTSYQPPSLSSSSSRAPQASFSYLATLQRFARAAGFSSRFAAQVGLAWRSSSRAFFRLGDLCLTSGPGQHDLVRSFWIEALVWPFRPPSWDLSAVLQFLNSSGFAPLHRVSLSFGKEGPVFRGLGLCQTGWWGAGCLWDGVFCSSRRLSLLCARVCHQDGVLFQFPSSLFLGGFLVGFCGWAGRWTAAVPVRALRLSSDQDFLLFSPLPRRLFAVPRMPFSGLVEDCRFFLPWGWCCKAVGRFCGSP